MARIGIVNPGEMGAGIGRSLVGRDHEVFWSSNGRSSSTTKRAEGAGLVAVGSLGALQERCPIVLSICPPHAALDVAREFVGYQGCYVDANAISPGRAMEVRTLIESSGGRYVDGGIIGAPPGGSQPPRFYLSGHGASDIAALFDFSDVRTKVISERPTAASALKMSYASWTKGTSALLLAVLTLARVEDVEEELLAEWSVSGAELPELVRQAALSARSKGWRWAGEMDEIAASFRAAGLPEGFHKAAAEIYRRIPQEDEDGSEGAGGIDVVESVVSALAEH